MNGDWANFKEQVRNAADIVEIISGYVPLKKKGQNYWGCCPFHGEKTPSFSVNPSKDMFYCFGCHEGGDIFKFLMKVENCSFVEALKLLAGRYGIAVPERERTGAELEREKQRKAVATANELAARYFRACLQHATYGQQAQQYLAGRGITPAICESFGIGYALDDYGAMVTALSKRGCSAQVLEAAGLVAQGRSGLYARFRHRVMIPIRDSRSRIVGFGGRVLDNSTPKYLNTSETQWFNKRRLLFGLDVAQKQIREQQQVIVVEGYMDAISLHAAGITNVVASMGTAFSQEQAQLLQRMGAEVVFCYDSDSAGRQASIRAVSVARVAELRVRIAGVPEGKDPDEFVRSRGRDAFLQVIAEAREGIEFQIEETLLQNNLSTLAGKVQAVSNILPFLLECKNEIEAAAHIRRLAQRLTIDEGLISEEYRKALRKGGRQRELQPPAELPVERHSVTQQAEELLLKLLLEQPQLLPECEAIVTVTGFSSPQRTQLYSLLAAGTQPAQLAAELDMEAQSVLAGLLATPLPEGDREQLLQDCLRQLQRTHLEQEYERHRLLADEYERSADERFLSELMESQRIKHEIRNLYGN